MPSIYIFFIYCSSRKSEQNIRCESKLQKELSPCWLMVFHCLNSKQSLFLQMYNVVQYTFYDIYLLESIQTISIRHYNKFFLLILPLPEKMAKQTQIIDLFFQLKQILTSFKDTQPFLFCLKLPILNDFSPRKGQNLFAEFQTTIQIITTCRIKQIALQKKYHIKLELTLASLISLYFAITRNTCRAVNSNLFFGIITLTYLPRMQASAEALRDSIWESLKAHFDKFKNKDGELQADNVDAFVVDVLKEETRNERDYVMKNLFRLDVDNSGAVSFQELGNFLFKRHCGEMSLQREHRAGRITHAADRKLTAGEFKHLINLAYDFLKVAIQADVANQIFGEVDKDHDGRITYGEYFQVIEQYICLPKEEGQLAKGGKVTDKEGNDKDKEGKQGKDKDKQGKEGKEGKEGKDKGEEGAARSSKLRRFIWGRLRRLYDGYMQGRSILANDAELRGLLLAIAGDLSANEIAFIGYGLDGLDWKAIDFDSFAERFINLIADVGLARFTMNRSASKRSLNVGEFIILLKNTFSFLKLDNFKDSILKQIFAKIDKNQDGLISYEDYQDWVKRFLAKPNYMGDEFFVGEDDEEKDPSEPFNTLPPPPANLPFTFDDYSFAKKVRARVWKLLIKYDKDENEEFSKDEIEAALVGLLGEKPDELRYVTGNVFRYDRNNDGEVTYHELTNFCTELHFGEMSIQRRHRKGLYSQGSKRIMNRAEFGQTIEGILEKIQAEGEEVLKASEAQLDEWFAVIDLDHDGWISYEVYFQFLRYYFGGASIAALETIHVKPKGKKVDASGKVVAAKEGAPAFTEDQLFLDKLKGLPLFERFTRIIVDQLRAIFFRYDYNHNKVFEANEVRDILEKVFELDSNELAYIMMKYFSVDAETNGAITFEELIALILSVYFVEIVFKRKHGQATKWNELKVSLPDFIALFTENCFFIRVRPSREDLQAIFKELDTDSDGFLTFSQYAAFVKKYLGNDLDLSSSRYSKDLTGVSEKELAFVQAIWDELKRYFDRYDAGTKGYLKEGELKEFVVEVLQETTERELNYVFWNLFRVDVDANKEVEFLQFAPFILNHAGEISLQRFHRTQPSGKISLAADEFYTVISNAYSFLSSMPKEKEVIQGIFDRIKGDKGQVSYAALLNWIHRALAAKYKK